LEHFEPRTVDELIALLAKFGGNVLFRGQTSHYEKDGKPSVDSSFHREGCIPSETLQWSRYVRNVLDVFIKPENDKLDFQQALLQQYGWRSFYVDCSSNAHVAAWFASHTYSDRRTCEMSEDFEERPVILCKKMAQYDFEEREGHLYRFDKSAAAMSGLVDLAALTIEEFRPRPVAQSAWLLGPLRGGSVPDTCFQARIKASRRVLREYAALGGFGDTNTLFPPEKEDPILHALLGLPWRKIESPRDPKFTIPVFKRALDLPEYQQASLKIAWPHTAFFSGTKISDSFRSIDGDHVGGIVLSVPNIALFGLADTNTPMRFPKVEVLVRENGTSCFEIDELIQYANMGHLTVYQKGIAVVPHEESLFEVCALFVEHPGLDMVRAGLNHGRFYRIESDGLWVREPDKRECDCGNDSIHNEHISALHIIEAFLESPEAFED